MRRGAVTAIGDNGAEVLIETGQDDEAAAKQPASNLGEPVACSVGG